MQEAKRLRGEGSVTELRRLKLEFRKTGAGSELRLAVGTAGGASSGTRGNRNRLALPGLG